MPSMLQEAEVTVASGLHVHSVALNMDIMVKLVVAVSSTLFGRHLVVRGVLALLVSIFGQVSWLMWCPPFPLLTLLHLAAGTGLPSQPPVWAGQLGVVCRPQAGVLQLPHRCERGRCGHVNQREPSAHAACNSRHIPYCNYCSSWPLHSWKLSFGSSKFIIYHESPKPTCPPVEPLIQCSVAEALLSLLCKEQIIPFLLILSLCVVSRCAQRASFLLKRKVRPTKTLRR